MSRIPRPSKMEVLALVLGVMALPLAYLAGVSAWQAGPAATVASVFGIVILYLVVFGVAALWSVRRNGRVRRGRVIAACLLASVAFSAVTYLLWILLPGTVIIDLGFDIATLEGGLMAIGILALVYFVIALALLAAASGAIWFMVRTVKALMPGYVLDIKRVRFSSGDPVKMKVKAWLVTLPRYLDPSTLALGADSTSSASVRKRLVNSLAWQMATGLLLAVYISLNPFLLESMGFVQAFALATISSIVVPLLVLPWSTLEALGLSVKGVRRDFMLHEGAKTRLLQSLVALGTLFIVLRLGLQRVGWESMVYYFANHVVTLLVVTTVVSFVYFYFFEGELIRHLRGRLSEAGVETRS